METESIKAERQRDADWSERERIQRYYKKALDYQKEHPEAALAEARKAAEAICKNILKKNKLDPGKATLQRLLEKLTSERLLKDIDLPPLLTIQKYGNLGVHDREGEPNEITAEYIQPCISALSAVVKWFLDGYNPDPNVELNPAIHQSARQPQKSRR